jgi:outer membrane protein assembly factor BamB
MTSSIFRRACLVVLTLALLGSATFVGKGHAQRIKKMAVPAVPVALPGGPAEGAPDAPPRDGFDFSGLALPKDEKGLKDKIKAAVDYIEEENWAIAIPHLQKIVDLPADVFVKLPRKTVEGKETATWVSARTEANRLIANLPKAGLEFYKLTYGAESLALLKKAKATGDPALLAEVMKRFAHTDAGAEAIVLLALYQLDRGNSVPADLCFQKLLHREGADKLPPHVLYYMAVAAHLAGDKAGEKQAWNHLKATGRDVALGKETRSVSELQDYVNGLQNSAISQDASEAVVYRAGLSRSNQLVGGPAFMEARWRAPMIRSDVAGPTFRTLQTAEKILHDLKQPILPAFFPVTATVVKDGKRQPLLIYKNFWGVHAVDMRTGLLQWDSGSTWSLEKMLAGRDSRKLQALNQWLNVYVEGRQRPALLFENANFGTLSTDNDFVYAIEDFLVPPTPQSAQQFNPGFPQPVANSYSSDVNDAIHHNRLQAFSLHKNGKLEWELGSVGEKNELSDSFFLGPPLPLGGRLYVLTEKQQELRLVCLDPREGGKVVSVQTLATADQKYQDDVYNRRSQAVHLAYGEGVLVVPTNTGALFAINLLENSLVWAYPYRDKDEAPASDQPVGPWGPGVMRRGVMIGPDGRPIQPPAPTPNQWKTSAPAIHDGKVVFTAPDARSLHCVNLRDGTRVWSVKRDDEDLYFAGVYAGKVLVVGKKKCRALNLNTGEIVWGPIDTGLPSGQGVASGNIYFLPIRERPDTAKEPEIAAIDVEKGVITAHTQSRTSEQSRSRDVPGNLLFYEGDVISQSAKEVAAYPQLKVKIAQMDEKIAKNPNDPDGLTERGELRLNQGDVSGAIEDLRRALTNKPGDDLRGRVRLKLYEAMTQYVKDHFDEAEQYLTEYEDLCKIAIEPGANDAQRAAQVAEERRRRSQFLSLVAEGRRGQGRLVEAFDKYQQFAEVARAEGLTDLVDERGVKANPDVWARGRIAAMVAAANPEQRKPLEDLIAARWDKLQGSGTLDELRQFVRLFGTLSPAAKEARFKLVDQLIDSSDPASLLEAERELLVLRSPRESPEIAGRAVEALARLYTRRGLLEDAGYCYRLLNRDYARIKIKGGKTGAELFDDAATDKRLMPHLDDVPLGPVGRLKVDAEDAGSPPSSLLYRFGHIGEPLPFFRRYDVAMSFVNQQEKFVLIDSRTGEERPPGKELSKTSLQTLLQQRAQTPNAPRLPYRSVGHLVVLPAGPMVFGIDPVNMQVLWERNLVAGTSTHSFTPERDGSVLLMTGEGFAQRIGQAGALEGNILCVQTHEALEALDPLTGKTLWVRTDVSPKAVVFADEEHVFVAETNNDGTASSTRVLRAADGVRIPKAPGFAAVFSKRLRLLGRNILASEIDPTGAVIVRLHDPLVGQDLWRQSFPARSLVLQSEEPNLTGAVEANGKVHVLDAHTGKVVFQTDKGYDIENPLTGIQPEHLANVQSVGLVADNSRVFVTCSAELDPNMRNFGGLHSNLVAQRGMRALPVNGAVYAWDFRKGAFLYFKMAPYQTVTLDRFAELPMLVLTSRYTKPFNGGPGRMMPGNVQQAVEVAILDKENGKLLYGDKEEGQNPNRLPPFHTLQISAREGYIDLVSTNKRLRTWLHSETARAGRSSEAGSATGPVGVRDEPLPRRMPPAEVPQVEIKR